MDQIRGPKMKQNVRDSKDKAFMSRELVRLKTDIPLLDNWSAWQPQEPDHDRVLAIFAKCGFTRMADEFLQEFPRPSRPSSGRRNTKWCRSQGIR